MQIEVFAQKSARVEGGIAKYARVKVGPDEAYHAIKSTYAWDWFLLLLAETAGGEFAGRVETSTAIAGADGLTVGANLAGNVFVERKAGKSTADKPTATEFTL